MKITSSSKSSIRGDVVDISNLEHELLETEIAPKPRRGRTKKVNDPSSLPDKPLPNEHGSNGSEMDVVTLLSSKKSTQGDGVGISNLEDQLLQIENDDNVILPKNPIENTAEVPPKPKKGRPKKNSGTSTSSSAKSTQENDVDVSNLEEGLSQTENAPKLRNSRRKKGIDSSRYPDKPTPNEHGSNGSEMNVITLLSSKKSTREDGVGTSNLQDELLQIQNGDNEILSKNPIENTAEVPPKPKGGRPKKNNGSLTSSSEESSQKNVVGVSYLEGGLLQIKNAPKPRNGRSKKEIDSSRLPDKSFPNEHGSNSREMNVITLLNSKRSTQEIGIGISNLEDELLQIQNPIENTAEVSPKPKTGTRKKITGSSTSSSKKSTQKNVIRVSRQNVVIVQTVADQLLPSKCSTDNTCEDVNKNRLKKTFSANTANTKSTHRKSKQTELTDSPNEPTANYSLTDPFTQVAADLEGEHTKGKRKLVEYDTPTNKMNKQEEKEKTTVRTARNILKRFLDINVKKGCVSIDDNCPVSTYKTDSITSRGNVLVITNIDFSDELKDRRGANYDHANIIELFRQMGFCVEDHINKTAKEMENIVENYCKHPKLENADIQITVVMSHCGRKSNKPLSVMGIDMHEVEVEWIVNQFSNTNCTLLARKPKIFMLQCCRGNKEEREKADGNITYTKSAKERKNSDILIAYSTVPGYVSYRNELTGSRYIRAICEVFMEHAHDTNVEDLLKIVDERINVGLTLRSRRLQTCTYENRGFKRCYLNPI